MIKRSPDAHIKTPANERQTQRFTRKLGQLHANPTKNALARFENHATRLQLLFKFPSLGAKSVGIGAVHLRVMLQQAVPG
jgi:hypothetical protein